MSKSQPWDYFPMIPVFAFTSVKKARKFVKKATGKDYMAGTGSGRCTWYDNGDGGFCVICLNCKESSSAHKYVTLAHECVHYAQYYGEFVGCRPDSETEAYLVESAMDACINQIGVEWFTETPQTSKSSAK